MKKIIFLITVLALLLTACSGETATTTDSGTVKASGGAAYVGTWMRQGNAPATMVLTPTSFDSSSDVCSLSGKLDVRGNTMVMTIEKTGCPGLKAGSKVTYTYSVSGNSMTLTNSEYGTSYSETYVRR